VVAVEDRRRGRRRAITAFGHWDLDGNGSNLIPTKALAQLGIKRVFNAHVHQPRHFERTGIEIINVGSLQTYGHGEGEELYVTIDVDQLKSNPDRYRDKCARIRLKEGELPLRWTAFRYRSRRRRRTSTSAPTTTKPST
jgi:hypothetical protein